MFSFRLDTNCIHIRGLDFEFPLFSFCGSAVAAVGRFFISLCLDFDCAAFIYFSAVEPGVTGGNRGSIGAATFSIFPTVRTHELLTTQWKQKNKNQLKHCLIDQKNI